MNQPNEVSRSRVHGVLVTYRRPIDLANTLHCLANQTLQLDTLVIVDNDKSCGAKPYVEAYPSAVYIAAGNNLGPAGGLALGISAVLLDTSENDWILLLDDDDPPSHREQIGQLYSFAERAASSIPAVGAVGLVGARYNYRRGRTERVKDSELKGIVRVHSLGGGQLPMYRAKTVRSVGVPDPSLFFGFEELEYGLRVLAAGWNIVVDGDEWRRLRAERGREGLARRHIRTRNLVAPWRAYYGTRNQIIIAKRFGGATASVLCTLDCLARLTRAIWQSERRATARMIAKGCVDGLLSRSGRRVDPSSPPEV